MPRVSAMKNALNRGWFWFSQTAAVLSLINIWSDARAWAELLRWVVANAPSYVADTLGQLANILSILAFPMDYAAEFIFSILHLDLPSWVFSLLVIISLFVTGFIRSSFLKARHQRDDIRSENANRDAQERRESNNYVKDSVMRGQQEADYYNEKSLLSMRLMNINRIVFSFVLVSASALLAADFVFWLVDPLSAP